mmetsp:Transcript_2190/g.4358  ORF Transcript_2190/g.4358 Transcript_2190/m.4358 type:complete len:269 (-) Transcript_2190:504-1310(-)
MVVLMPSMDRTGTEADVDELRRMFTGGRRWTAFVSSLLSRTTGFGRPSSRRTCTKTTNNWIPSRQIHRQCGQMLTSFSTTLISIRRIPSHTTSSSRTATPRSLLDTLTSCSSRSTWDRCVVAGTGLTCTGTAQEGGNQTNITNSVLLTHKQRGSVWLQRTAVRQCRRTRAAEAGARSSCRTSTFFTGWDRAGGTWGLSLQSSPTRCRRSTGSRAGLEKAWMEGRGCLDARRSTHQWTASRRRCHPANASARGTSGTRTQCIKPWRIWA